jgi:hypothetical protein
MKLYKVPETLVRKLPIGKIIKYIKKDDKSLTPKTGVILKHNENDYQPLFQEKSIFLHQMTKFLGLLLGNL